MSSVVLATAANGHAWIHTRSAARAWRISLLLMFRHGFRRRGSWVPGIAGEAVYPDYRRGKLRILSGWDDCVGYDFLSDDEETDRFLESFADRHLEGAIRAE